MYCSFIVFSLLCHCFFIVLSLFLNCSLIVFELFFQCMQLEALKITFSEDFNEIPDNFLIQCCESEGTT